MRTKTKIIFETNSSGLAAVVDAHGHEFQSWSSKTKNEKKMKNEKLSRQQQCERERKRH